MSQRYFFVAELVGKVPSIAVVIHDDSCHLRKFAESHGRDSEAAARLMHPHIRYIIDRLHSKGQLSHKPISFHMDTRCNRTCWEVVHGLGHVVAVSGLVSSR
jgi:hypothetical protein